MTIYRATLRGNLGAGDIWQAGFCLQSDDFIDALAGDIAAAATPALVDVFDAHPPSTTCSDVVVAEINPATGRVVDSFVQALSITGNGAATALPSEVAVVVSLRETNGTTRGRFYLPAPNRGQVTETGRILPAWITGCGTNLQTFFAELGALSASARLGIYSPTQNEFKGVTTFSIGDVFDAQRRRRNKLIEARQSWTVA